MLPSSFPIISQSNHYYSVDQIYQRNYLEVLNLIQNLPGIAYRLLFNHQKHNILFISNGSFDLTGYTPEDLIKKAKDNYYNLIHPDDINQVKLALNEQLKQNHNYELEYRIITAQGEIKWVIDRGILINLNQEGDHQYLEGFVTDITKQKQTEIETSLLYELSCAISSADNLDQAFQLTLEKIESITCWDFGEIWLPNQEQTQLEYHLACYDLKTDQEIIYSLEKFKQKSYNYTFELNEGLPGKIWYSKSPYWINDVSQEPFFLRQQLALKCGLKASFGVPILANSEVVAVMIFFMRKSHSADQKLSSLITFIASQLGKFIQKKQIEEALKQAEANYRGIVQNALEGIFQSSLDGQYLSTNPALARIYGYNSCDDLTNNLTDITNQLYVDPQQRQKFIKLLQENEVISNFESQVYRQDGSIIWISENARAVKDEGGNILYYEGTVEDITERKMIKESLHLKAFYDSLTNLPNRAFLMNKLNFLLEKCRQDYVNNVDNPYHFAVLFLDLDRFKLINDSLGHLIGDKLLIEIARRLEICVRQTDTVSRLGGDEFTIVLEEINDIQQAINIAERIIETINQPFEIEGNLIYTGTSIGVWFSEKAYFLVDQSANSLDNLINQSTQKCDLIYVKKPEDLLKDADAALYSAKAQGKGNYKIFDHSMKQNALEILELEVDLRQAWANQEFQIYYQPIYNLTNQKIVSLEVLLRWDHAVKGVISASKFIKILEESNLIITVEDWVLKTALQQLERWHHLLLLKDDQANLFKLHLNLSKKYFLQPNFIEKIAKILENYQNLAPFICFEMNQNHGLNFNLEAIKKLDYLQSQGIELCLEDFGTKNSSLNNLYQLPIKAIKIDPEFINNIENNPKKETIAEGIFALADRLEIQAIAQGIETEEQLIKLKKLNCQFGQGYYLNVPMNVTEIESIIFVD